MVSDIRLDENMDVVVDASNDIGLVSGNEQFEQSLATDVKDELEEIVGGRVSGENIGMLEESMREALEEDPQVGQIAYVNVIEFNRQTESAVAEVGVVEDENFNIEVSS